MLQGFSILLQPYYVPKDRSMPLNLRCLMFFLCLSHSETELYCIDSMKYLSNMIKKFWKIVENRRVEERKLGKLFGPLLIAGRHIMHSA